MSPLVSILVPSYNHSNYLKERIDSIFNQTCRSFELIVIDDRSKDDSDKVLKELLEKFSFYYIQNASNSGTPFAAWERICDLAKGEFIWICESDDVAEPTFLETAVERLSANPSAAFFYSNSFVIDESSCVLGNTESYFRENWKGEHWDSDFSSDGLLELRNYQLRGQTVPNMSSALFRTDVFRKAFDPYLKRFRLTGDWLFVGQAMQFGDVEFSAKPLSRFRKHKETSRVRVQSARSQAEFVLTKFRLFKSSRLPISDFAPVMGSDVVRFLYEPASLTSVIKAAFGISVEDSIKCAFFMLLSAFRNPAFYKLFLEKYKHSKRWRKDND